jgi:hypothetical protein
MAVRFVGKVTRDEDKGFEERTARRQVERSRFYLAPVKANKHRRTLELEKAKTGFVSLTRSVTPAQLQ